MSSIETCSEVGGALSYLRGGLSFKVLKLADLREHGCRILNIEL